MRRRDFLSCAIPAAVALRTERAAAASPRKNVVLILSDQHKRDCLGATGDPIARTPNLDGLAREGVRFTSAYCSNPVCTPARASLLGLACTRITTANQFDIRVDHNIDFNGQLTRQAATAGRRLRWPISRSVSRIA